MKRAIHIFPPLHSAEKIQQIRNVYDPLSDKIPPHITLLFPFESYFPQNAILDHVESIARHTSPFRQIVVEEIGADDVSTVIGRLPLNTKRF